MSLCSDWYCSELHKHPVFAWAAFDNVILPEVEFAQHYGIPTALMDMSESLEVALFFATHEFRDAVAYPCTEGTGILYRIDWLTVPAEVSNRFRPIAIQPFQRPFRQWAWSCEIMLGESFEGCPGLIAVEFSQDEAFGNRVREIAEAEGDLFPPDPMAKVAEFARSAMSFPTEIAERVVKDVCSDPGGLPNESVKHVVASLRSAGFELRDLAPPLLSDTLKSELVARWEADKPEWNASIAAGFELLLTRTRRDAQQGNPADA